MTNLMCIQPYHLSPEQLAKTLQLDYVLNIKDYGAPLVTLAAMFVALRLRWFTWLRDRAAAITARKWLQGLIFLPMFILFLWLTQIPIDLWLHQVRFADGISLQPWSGWIADQLKTLVIDLILGTAVASAGFAIIRKSQRRWWLWFWLLSVPIISFSIYLTPNVIAPMFDKFEPLVQTNPAVVDRLEVLIAKCGVEIPPSRVLLKKTHSKSSILNASVEGIGPSSRIVIDDTTIMNEPADDTLFIAAHEMGHYVFHHTLKRTCFSLLLSLILLFLVSRVAPWMIRRVDSWHITGIGDWAAAGVLALLFVVLGFFERPAENTFSRMQEHHADIYGQEAIHGMVANPALTAADSFQRMGESNLDPPKENALIVFWSYTHPGSSSRLDFAAGYDPWQAGRQPIYFHP